MKLSVAALALALAGASAQSTVLAPCGTDCPTAVPDKTITRSKAMPTETSPCPSLMVSSKAGAGNGTNQMVMSASGGPTPTPTAFAGGASQVGASTTALLALCAAFLAMY